MALKRMDNVRIVVDDLGDTMSSFVSSASIAEGATIEREWAGRVTGASRTGSFATSGSAGFRYNCMREAAAEPW